MRKFSDRTIGDLIPEGGFYEIRPEDMGAPTGDLAYGLVLSCDLGKRMFRGSYGLVMETTEQMMERRGLLKGVR